MVHEESSHISCSVPPLEPPLVLGFRQGFKMFLIISHFTFPQPRCTMCLCDTHHCFSLNSLSCVIATCCRTRSCSIKKRDANEEHWVPRYGRARLDSLGRVLGVLLLPAWAEMVFLSLITHWLMIVIFPCWETLGIMDFINGYMRCYQPCIWGREEENNPCVEAIVLFVCSNRSDPELVWDSVGWLMSWAELESKQTY